MGFENISLLLCQERLRVERRKEASSRESLVHVFGRGPGSWVDVQSLRSQTQTTEPWAGPAPVLQALTAQSPVP